MMIQTCIQFKNQSFLMTYTLPPTYGYTLISACLNGLLCIVFAFLFPMRGRKKYFTKEFMTQHFEKVHQEAFNEEINEGGYPDSGSGYYSQKLSYKDWFDFNGTQRVHLNIVEWIGSCLAFLLIAGLYFPITAACFGLGMILGRILYAIGYVSTGPKGRSLGAIINDLSVIALFGLGIAAGILMIIDSKQVEISS